jgi:NAD(P)-dependent dehydrogenase (short-subunit alcohol dehydrogenase family)
MRDAERLKILLSGANRGLGLALCEYFLQKNHTVYALVRTMSTEISALKEKYDQGLFIFNTDVTNREQLQEAFRRIKERTSALDILINNAAVHLEQRPPDLGEIDFSVYGPTFEVNAVAPLKVIEVFLPLVLSGNKKLIVNITSEAGSIGSAWREREYAYCMSKAALNMASKILDNRLRKEGIKVLAVHPGWFSSDMGGKEAPITPRQAALNVAGTIVKDWHSRNAIYIDAQGRELPW